MSELAFLLACMYVMCEAAVDEWEGLRATWTRSANSGRRGRKTRTGSTPACRVKCNIIYLILKLINNLDLPSLLGDQRIAAGVDVVYQAESRPYRHNQVQTHAHLYTSKHEPSSCRRRWPRSLSILGRRILIGRLESREKSFSLSLFIHCLHIFSMHTREPYPEMSLFIYCSYCSCIFATRARETYPKNQIIPFSLVENFQKNHK
jgi:hypothetical protein